MNILIIAAEVAPFAKVGGLADVAGALPKALKAMGHDVRVAMPCYKMIETNPEYAVTDVLSPFPVTTRVGTTEQAFVKKTSISSLTAPEQQEDITVYLIGNPDGKRKRGYFQQATESKKVYSLQPEPYVFFCHAVLEMLPRLDDAWQPDILHCNDWQTGLIPVLQKTYYRNEPTAARAATVFTIHNLAYQGNFERDQWPAAGLPDSLYQVNGLEFYGGWSFMKGALTCADRINTVSETYAREIQTPEYGCGLEGLMQTLTKEGRLSGILNGIDYEEYDPASDPRLPAHFSAANPTGKTFCRHALQQELNLPQRDDIPVIGLVSRLADQKGLDLIHAVAEDMLSLGVQFVLLGTGDPVYERYFNDLQKRYPSQVHARIGFDIDLAQRIYAGSDLFLMPSRFEPSGLGQMFALRYGTIPIVRATGGLADTIVPYGGEEGNGFVFTDYSGPALMQAICQALGLFHKPIAWQSLVQRALLSDFSWERSASRYVDLYRAAQTDSSRAR
jgi:starch synthase